MGPDTRLRRKLTAWYLKNRRDLPWRRTSDPYRIWLSEIMLQQTRAQAVIPYYHRFLREISNSRGAGGGLRRRSAHGLERAGLLLTRA